MFKLQVSFPVWIIDHQTCYGKGTGFIISYGPFNSEQQGRWFWLCMKEKLQRPYDAAYILDKDGVKVYIDEHKGA